MPPKKPAVVKLPPVLNKGHVLFDKNKKKHWVLDRQIGSGGFGRIYESHCSETAEHAVVKMEHLNSGPLFCEQNFAVRCLKKEVLMQWIKMRRIDFLPLPEFYSFGVTEDGLYRFVVMQRLGRNLEEVLTNFDWHLPDTMTFRIAVEMINALEFIHHHGYVHADVKGSNIIFGHGGTEASCIYLCDFGLVAKVPIVYKEDKKLKHNGTIEYTSREAHRGAAPSRRGDLEILSYCLLHWMKGSLPWGSLLNNPDAVSTAKHSFFDKLPKSLIDFYPSCPAELLEFFMSVNRLPYESPPDYAGFRKIFLNGLMKRKASANLPYVFAPKAVKVTKAKSVTSPVQSHVQIERPVAPIRRSPSKLKTFGVTSGPLAVAAARSRKDSPVKIKSHALVDSGGSSPALSRVELKRKHESPVVSKLVKQKTPSSGKPCSPRNFDCYDYYASDDEDDRSILYKTAFPEMPPDSDSDDLVEELPPKPTPTRSRRIGTKK